MEKGWKYQGGIQKRLHYLSPRKPLDIASVRTFLPSNLQRLDHKRETGMPSVPINSLQPHKSVLLKMF